MKRVLFLGLLALALPMAAFANSTTDFNSFTAWQPCHWRQYH